MKQKQDDPFYIPIIIVVFILIFSCIIYRVWLKKYISIPTCYFYSYWGVFCPGCGCTRAFIYLLKGDIIKSLSYNPTVIYASFMTIIYLTTQTLSRILKRKKLWKLEYNPIYLYIGIAILITTCIIKNIIKFIK